MAVRKENESRKSHTQNHALLSAKLIATPPHPSISSHGPGCNRNVLLPSRFGVPQPRIPRHHLVLCTNLYLLIPHIISYLFGKKNFPDTNCLIYFISGFHVRKSAIVLGQGKGRVPKTFKHKGAPVREETYPGPSACEVSWPVPFIVLFIPPVLPPGTHFLLGGQWASIQPKPWVGLEIEIISTGNKCLNCYATPFIVLLGCCCYCLLSLNWWTENSFYIWHPYTSNWPAETGLWVQLVPGSKKVGASVLEKKCNQRTTKFSSIINISGNCWL